jgi:sugar lactone lactonase YvrE
VDGAGNVYVADSSNHAIRKISTAGEVTTFAGLAGVHGYADGIGGDARFFDPEGIAVDAGGIVYVGDSLNNRIRKITPEGAVTTLAGAGRGSTDGTGTAARFNFPRGLAVDSAGNVYVADQYNHTIRKVSPEGMVTTLAGQAGSPGTANGIGSDAQFSAPDSVAVDRDGNVYVAESNYDVIRKITPRGVVTTFAGKSQGLNFADGEASQARFLLPRSVVLDNSGNFYVADYGGQTIRKGTLEKPAAFLALISSTIYRDAAGTVVKFYVAGVAGLSVVVEASPDLVNWLPLDTNTLSGLFDFTDSQNSVASNRFYRARVP